MRASQGISHYLGESTMERSRENLRFWRTLVGLPPEFPNLRRLDRDNILEQMVINPEVEGDIWNALSSRRLTAILVKDGCGLSTLCQYLLRLSEDKAVDSLVIPVLIDLGEPQWQKEITADSLETEIKYQIIWNLVHNPWEQKLDTAHYFYCINYEEDLDFHAFRAECLNFLSPQRPSATKFLKKFPFFKQGLGDILNYLLQNLRIQTAIFYHFPQLVEGGQGTTGAPFVDTLYEQRAMDVVSSVKILMERNPFLPASIREIYFCTPRTRRDLTREFRRDFFDIKYPPYTSAQIFAMLVKRYKPSLPGRKGVREYKDLGSVFSEKFVRQAWDDNRPIREIIVRVQELMLERLDCDKKEIPYRLEPAEMMYMPKAAQAREIEPEMPDASGAGESEPEAPRKKFIRKKRSTINGDNEQ